MAATITGVVYNDLNHNGQYDAGEPGLANVAVVLYNASAGCTEVRTGADGSFSLTVNAAGAYTVYEPVTAGSGCPPTLFTQPAGFTMSNTARKQSVTVTAAQVANGAVISGVSFGHDATDSPLMCSTRMIQFVGRPTLWYNINLVTGLPVLQGALSPAHDVNAIGYNPLDDYIYGYDQTTNALVRVTAGGRLIQLSRPTGLPAGNYNTGTFDANGFLYLFINDANRFYTVDLRPNSATFLKLVNPAAGYTEQTANFGTAMSAALNISDWVYDPSDGNLYGVQRNGVLARVVPTTGQVTILTTSAPNPSARWPSTAPARFTPLPTTTARSTSIPTSGTSRRAFPSPRHTLPASTTARCVRRRPCASITATRPTPARATAPAITIRCWPATGRGMS